MCLTLPLYYSLKDNEQDYIIEKLLKLIAKLNMVELRSKRLIFEPIDLNIYLNNMLIDE